jgi:hypothetical protein
MRRFLILGEGGLLSRWIGARFRLGSFQSVYKSAGGLLAGAAYDKMVESGLLISMIQGGRNE